MNEVIIFCDGSAIGNPGPGGWGMVAICADKKDVEEAGGFNMHTTNNRMELTAAIEGLKQLPKKSKVLIKTDSQYVINGATKWVFGWMRNNWQTSQKTEVLNKDLWEELVTVSKEHSVSWEHVRGHEGVTLNERVDMIANGFARKEEVILFKGNEDAYAVFLEGMPKARSVGASSKKGKAYSYVSCIDGIVATYATWAECENAVKGKSAKFKKTISKEDEVALIALWNT